MITEPTPSTKSVANTESTTTFTAFTINQANFGLQNMWILDSGADTHVYNNADRFIFKRPIGEQDTLISGKDIYQIEAFGRVKIIIQTPAGPKHITLLDVALSPGFFTNTASLNKFMARDVH